jgi:hypothetical protein
MAKDKGGREAKKPKADKNKKVSGQTPGAREGTVAVGSKGITPGR